MRHARSVSASLREHHDLLDLGSMQGVRPERKLELGVPSGPGLSSRATSTSRVPARTAATTDRQ